MVQGRLMSNYQFISLLPDTRASGFRGAALERQRLPLFLHRKEAPCPVRLEKVLVGTTVSEGFLLPAGSVLQPRTTCPGFLCKNDAKFYIFFFFFNGNCFCRDPSWLHKLGVNRNNNNPQSLWHCARRVSRVIILAALSALTALQ